MCKQDFKIHFCSCEKKEEQEKEIIHNKNSRRFKRTFNKDEYLKKKFIWYLFEYVGSVEFSLIGLILPPEEKLTEEITSEYLLYELNNNSELFDFDYLPNEGDSIVVRSEYINKEIKGKKRPHLFEHLSFIYKKEKWEINSKGSEEISQEIAKGILKIRK